MQGTYKTTATPDRRVKLRRGLHSEILADDKVEKGQPKAKILLTAEWDTLFITYFVDRSIPRRVGSE